MFGSVSRVDDLCSEEQRKSIIIMVNILDVRGMHPNVLAVTVVVEVRPIVEQAHVRR